jgi:quercetin dioxygenase-like cupin family protein
MIIRRWVLVVCGLAAVLAAHELPAQEKADNLKVDHGKAMAKATTPAEMTWSAQGGLAMPGMEQVNLVGNPSEPGPYTLRLKFPAGYKLAPHVHPDNRKVTVLAGTWYTGYGAKFEETALKALPAGSFYTEPANAAHFVEVREPVVIQVSGMGPSGRRFVDPADGQK